MLTFDAEIRTCLASRLVNESETLYGYGAANPLGPVGRLIMRERYAQGLRLIENPIMNRPTTVVAVALLLPTPAIGETVLTIQNQGTEVLVAVNSFPIGRDGEVIDDNIGGLDEDTVQPGDSGTVRHVGDCGLVEMYFRYASDRADDRDQVFRVDTCQAQNFVLQDTDR